MKKTLAGIAITMVVTAAAITGCTGREKPVILLAQNDWISQIIATEVVDQIITRKLDYATERVILVPAHVWPAMEKGAVDLSTEIWLPNRQSEIQPYLGRGTLELGRENYPGGNAWVVPRFVVHGDPARGIEPVAPDLESIIDLKDEREGGKGYWKLFENPINPGLGELVGGPPHWATSFHDLSLILGYKLPLWYSHQSEETMCSRLIAADRKGEPLLMFIWYPHWIFAAVDLLALTFPNPYDPDAFAVDTVKPVRSGHEIDCLSIRTVVRTGLRNDAPDVYRLVKNFNIGTDINALMLRVEFDREDVAVVAAGWIAENQDKIDRWLTDR